MANEEKKKFMNLSLKEVPEPLMRYTKILAGLMDISREELVISALEQELLRYPYTMGQYFQKNEEGHQEFQNYIAELKLKHRQYSSF